MKEQTRIDSEALMVEIARYLAAVDTFRAANCEPVWRPELESSSDPIVHGLARHGQAASAAGS